MITGESFSSDFGPFRVWKLEFPVAVKIILIETLLCGQRSNLHDESLSQGLF